MAKKKVTHHSEKKATKSQEKEVPSTTAAIEVTREKMERLKSLNDILIKEIVEHRQQVYSLLQSQWYLEMELNRCNSEKESLMTELERLNERDMRVEVERKVERGVMIAEMVEIKKVFMDKEDKVEEMKRQVKFLQNSVVEAHKKKRFWTIVSSTTTIFAAISVAYLFQRR